MFYIRTPGWNVASSQEQDSSSVQQGPLLCVSNWFFPPKLPLRATEMSLEEERLFNRGKKFPSASETSGKRQGMKTVLRFPGIGFFKIGTDSLSAK